MREKYSMTYKKDEEETWGNYVWKG